MLVQIALDYPGLHDVLSLDVSEIRYFYDRVRPALLVKYGR